MIVRELVLADKWAIAGGVGLFILVEVVARILGVR